MRSAAALRISMWEQSSHHHDSERLDADSSRAAQEMIAAAAAGEKFDASLGAKRKLRSKHNTFLAVPVVFLMLSNHYPVATYGNRYGGRLYGACCRGWIAAKLIREF